MEDIRLLHGDCLEQLKCIPDGTIDMILTDPPYSSGGLYAGDRKADTRTKYTDCDHNGAARLKSFSGDNMDQRSFTECMRMVFAKAREKCVPEAVLATFVDWRNLPVMTDAVQAAGWVWRGIVVWDKGAARNIPGRYRQDCEYIVWATNGPRKVDWSQGGPALPGRYHIPIVNPKKRLHQTEKPVELLEALLKITNAGDTILDLYMGGGSTGVACVNTGRRFVGIELDQHYYNVSQDRIRAALEEKQAII